MRERAKSESKGMKTTGGREGGEEKEGERERVSGTVQLCERIKQSLLCQRLNTPAEDISYSRSAQSMQKQLSLCFLMVSTTTAKST